MAALADSLIHTAKQKDVATHQKPWYVGKLELDACTKEFEAGQAFSCTKTAKAQVFQTCP